MQMDREEVKAWARPAGADLVGIASVDRFAGLPAEAHPASIQPQARSVIVLGFQVLRGSLRGVQSGLAQYTLGMGSGVPIMVDTTYDFCCALEAAGAEAVPLFDLPGELRGQGVRVHPDRPEPDVVVDMEYAAHAAGLGEIGRGKLFLTPQFGPLQTFCAVLTDAEIEPDPVRERGLCDDCMKCIEACPARALSAGETSTAELCDGPVSWQKLHVESCLVCRTGVMRNVVYAQAEPSRLAAACGRACLQHLEAQGRLERRWVLPFAGGEAGGESAC